MIRHAVTRREILLGTLAIPALTAAISPERQNVIVFKQAGRYGGWPANHGIWAWQNEIVVGYTAATFKHAVNDHSVDRSKPFDNWQSRSLDGGDTWTIEKPSPIAPPENGGSKPQPLRSAIDFTAPGFAMMFAFANIQVGPSWFYVSADRCQTWSVPYEFTVAGIDKICTRTDYIVLGQRECLMFGSAAKANDKEGRVFCAKTTDGGLSWKLVSLIGPEPSGYMIMPSTVQLGPGRFLTTIRHWDPQRKGSIDAYTSDDSGRSWKAMNPPAPSIGGGNPPALIMLRDGRLALTYGYRAKPFGVRARISEDKGLSWGNEIVLRDDAPSGDLGYPRAVQRPDGKILSVYYFNGPNDDDRAIEGTIWKA